jgi:PhzF family phenazine biosynthesis protein
MKLTAYHVDAFTDHVFGGNPASVIPLKKWLPDALMQNMAMEHNLAETVFFVPSEKKGIDFDIRWFTPTLEINLCGHATLASAHVIFEELGWEKKKIVFDSKSGPLVVKKSKGILEMDFPSWKPGPYHDYPSQLAEALGGVAIQQVLKYREIIVVLENEAAVINCKPNFSLLRQIGTFVVITAPGDSVDFVSRFFAPTAGIDEDPVTGSAHSQLIPYWSERLGKSRMIAKQLSARVGDLICEQLNEERVLMCGTCVSYMKATIKI